MASHPNAGVEAVVDVLIAVWNCAESIERAVRSALAEPEVRKVIVVDDASTDDTAACARQVAPETGRVAVLRLAANGGPSAARNRGLDLSDAPWIAILDGDDSFLPGRIGKLLAAAGEADLLADDILQIDEAKVGKEQPRPMQRDGAGRARQLSFETFVLGNVSRRGAERQELGFLKPMIRRSFLDHHGLRYDERLRLGEDYALYAQALALGARFRLLPPCGYVSVARAHSLSGRHSKRDLERLRDVDLKLQCMARLSAADRRALTAHYRSVDAKVQWLAVIEAFKRREAGGFVAPFLRSPQVSMFLARRLIAEGSRRFALARAPAAQLRDGGG